jgi:hypothetical protein
MTRLRVTTRQLFLRGCWVPPALWGATLLYLRPYDGWGAWAAAPLLLPALALGLLWLALGGVTLVRAARQRRPIDLALLAATLVGGSPAIWYLFRHLIRTFA